MIHRIQLDNGLTVLFKEDHRSKVAISSVWVKAGAIYEWPEVRGWSHGIEHNLFKGTRKRTGPEISRDVFDAGGTLNAGTSFTYTNYHIVLPSENFQVALDVHSDVLQHSRFDPQELDSERRVLVQENQMYRDQPGGFGFTFTRVAEMVFKKHPFRYPIGGPDENLLNTGRKQILDYFNRFYVPNNMVYVVVGDLSFHDWEKKIRKAFGSMKARELPPTEFPVEPQQKALRYQSAVGDVQGGYLKIGFRTPGTLEEDAVTLDLLIQILASGSSSRLNRALRDRKKLITSVDEISVGHTSTGLAVFDFVLEPKMLKPVLKAFYEELGRIAREPVAVHELDKFRKAAETLEVTGLETVQGQAHQLGYYALHGDYLLRYQRLDAMKQVTPADLLRVARTWLTPDKSSVFFYHAGGHAVTLKQADVRRISADAYSRQRDRKTAPVKTTLVEGSCTLDNGLKVVYQRIPDLPVISTALIGRYGQRFEQPEASGLTRLLQHTLMKGTRHNDEEEITRRYEALGASISTVGTSDLTGAFMINHSRDQEATLDLLREVVLEPAFSSDIVAREAGMQIQQIARSNDVPMQAARRSLQRAMFGDHGYGLFSLGDPDYLQRITRTQLVRTWKQFFVPENMVLSMAGDLNPDTLIPSLTKRFGRWRNGNQPLPKGFRYPTIRGIREDDIQRDLQQSVVLLGMPGPTLHNPDRYPLLMVEETMSDLSGRLFRKLRDEKGLCYYAGLSLVSYFDAGMLVTYVGTETGREQEATDAMIEELALLRDHGLTDKELKRAKAKLLGGLEIGLQRSSERALMFARLELRGKSFRQYRKHADLIRAITKADVQRVIDRYIDLENYRLTRIHP